MSTALRRRLADARLLGPLGPRRQQRARQALQGMGRQEQCRRPHRLHHLARREGQADSRGRSASRHRPRHHVPSRLEHSDSPERCWSRSTTSPTQLIKQYGPISPVAEYLAKIKGTWRGIPTAVGSQVKPCCSRFDLYKEHCGIDLLDMFPADESKWDKAKTDTWTWDALSRLRHRSCTTPAIRSACPWARPATRSTGSARCSTPSAWSWSTPRTTSRSTRTRPARRWNISRS